MLIISTELKGKLVQWPSDQSALIIVIDVMWKWTCVLQRQSKGSQSKTLSFSCENQTFNFLIRLFIFTVVCTFNSQTFNLSRYVQIGVPSVGHLKFVLGCMMLSRIIRRDYILYNKLTTCARHIASLQKKHQMLLVQSIQST